MRQHDMSVIDYTSKIKDICDSLASIDVNVEEGEMVQICLGGYLYKGEYAIVFRLTVDAPCRGEPRWCLNKYARLHQDVVHGGR